MEENKLARTGLTVLLYIAGTSIAILAILDTFRLPEGLSRKLIWTSKGILYPQFNLAIALLALLAFACFQHRWIHRTIRHVTINKVKVKDVEFSFNFFAPADFMESEITGRTALLNLLHENLNKIHQQFQTRIGGQAQIPAELKTDARILQNPERCATLLFTFGGITTAYLGLLLTLYKYQADISVQPLAAEEAILIKAVGLSATLLARLQGAEDYSNNKMF